MGHSSVQSRLVRTPQKEGFRAVGIKMGPGDCSVRNFSYPPDFLIFDSPPCARGESNCVDWQKKSWDSSEEVSI